MNRSLPLLIIGFLYFVPLQSQEFQEITYTYKQLNSMLNDARASKNSAQLGDAYFLLGQYEEQKNYNSELAFEYYIRSKTYYEREGNEKQNSKIDWIIAKRYMKSGFYKESLTYYNKILNYYKKVGDVRQQAYILFEMSEVHSKKGEPEQSINSLNQSLNINKILRDSILLVDHSLLKAERHLVINELDSALYASASAFTIATQLENKQLQSRSLYYIGKINLLQKDVEKAIKYLSHSERILEVIPFSELRRDIYKSLSEAYERRSNFREAYVYGKKLNSLNDSILNQNRLKIINDLAIRNQVTEKNKDIATLEMEKKSIQAKTIIQRNALYFVAAGFFLLLIALYYLMRFYNHKISTRQIINEQQHEIDQQKIRELEDNIKISSMQSMIVGQEKERERIAKDLHDSLGGLLSTVKLQFDNVKQKISSTIDLNQFEKASGMLDDAVEEVRSISRNLQPGALKDLGLIPALNDLINRFENDNYPEIYFQYFSMPEKIDDMVSLTVYRIIQELLTNSIKHAKAKEILIQLNSEDQDLIIQYEDDGLGFSTEVSKRKGMGLDNIKSRIIYLKGTVSVTSTPNEGVSFLIRIPIKIENEDERKPLSIAEQS